jgi:UDP:flavonoid glycosyltransferase YjiC (YdhE family)
MRILFTTSPGLGHFFPIVPLAWAVRATGHEVLIASTNRAVEASGRAGLPAVDVVPGIDITDVFCSRRERLGASSAMFRDPFSTATWATAAALFAEISDKMADGIVQVAGSWRPHLVVHTPLEAAGPLAAALLSVPAVRHEFGLRPVGGVTGLMDLLYQAMRPTYQRHGLAGEPAQPAAVVDPCPPSMREPDRPTAWAVRYVLYNGGGALPDWLMEPPTRPRICVTLGSVVPHGGRERAQWGHRGSGPAGCGGGAGAR